MTAGLRWDQPSAYSEANNNDTVFLPNQASPLGSFFNTVTGQQQQLMGNVALLNSPAWPSPRRRFALETVLTPAWYCLSADGQDRAARGVWHFVSASNVGSRRTEPLADQWRADIDYQHLRSANRELRLHSGHGR